MPVNGVAYPAQVSALFSSFSAGEVGFGAAPTSLASLPSARDAQAVSRLWYRLNRSLLTLREAATDLARPELWTAKTASSTDPTTVIATARAEAASGTYAVSVQALAKAEKLATADFATSATPLGVSGTFRLEGHEVKVEAGDSLWDLAGKINKSGAGVTAKAEQAAEGGYHLTLASGKTGQAGALVLADVTPGALAALGLVDAQGQKARVQQAAEDAAFTVDGKAVTSGTNNPVVTGVQLTLLKTTEATAGVSITVKHDDEAVLAAARKFTAAYNAALGQVSGLTRTGGRAARTGAQNLQRQLVSALQGTLRGEAAPPRPAEQGFRLGPGGTLSLDETAFRKRLAADREEIAEAFASPKGAAERVEQALVPLTSPASGNEAAREAAPAAWLAGEAFSSVTPTATTRELDLRRQAFVLQSSLALLREQQSTTLDRLQALFNPLS